MCIFQTPEYLFISPFFLHQSTAWTLKARGGGGLRLNFRFLWYSMVISSFQNGFTYVLEKNGCLVWREEVGPYARIFANLYRKIPPKSKSLFLRNGSKWKKLARKLISDAENWLRPRKYGSPQSHATNFWYFEFLKKYGRFSAQK